MDAPRVVGSRGMVVSDSSVAAKVGQEVLASGGNAVDAAIATAFALAVAYPAAGNLGGGGFLVARVGGQSYALDFRETAPGKSTADMYLKDGKPTSDSRTGYRASGVPGSVAGLWEAHKKLATKPWKELLAPAIKLAEQGFVVDAAFVDPLESKYLGERLQKLPYTKKLYYPGGKPPEVGSTWKDPDLAAVLKRIAEKGPPGFYEGTVADLIVAEMQRGKGLITHADLKAYKAKWRTPLDLDYRGHHVVAMPPPSSGGVTLGMICHIVEGYDFSKMAWHGAEHLHYDFEAMRRAFAARNARLGDPDFVQNPVDELLGKAWADAQRATIKADKATPSSEIVSRESSGDGPHTSHFSVVDEQGNAVALTTTLNWWFGSGVAVTGAGFMMNNEMDDFAAKPGTANSYGLVQSEPNAIAPGKRPLSSMTPTIVLDRSDNVELVLGAAGGPRIITTVFQILSNVVDYNLDVVASTNAPRFHQQHLPDVVAVEPHGLPDDVKKQLEAMGYKLDEKDHLADAPEIGRAEKGWMGAPEPRRNGAFAAGW
jgi:gamma-glutamyltranspeptidase/glutathione hydrolase